MRIASTQDWRNQEISQCQDQLAGNSGAVLEGMHAGHLMVHLQPLFFLTGQHLQVLPRIKDDPHGQNGQILQRSSKLFNAFHSKPGKKRDFSSKILNRLVKDRISKW